MNKHNRNKNEKNIVPFIRPVFKCKKYVIPHVVNIFTKEKQCLAMLYCTIYAPFSVLEMGRTGVKQTFLNLFTCKMVVFRCKYK